MPNRTHVCAVPGCPELEPCPEHGRVNQPWSKDRDMAAHARFARAVRKRDRVCRGCGATTGLQAHHVRPGVHDPALGILLCDSCHRRIDEHAR